MIGTPEEHQQKAIFKAQFSMGQYDYERFHEMLKAMDDLSVRVQTYDTSALMDFYAVLWEIYKNFRPILFDTVRVTLEKDFAAVKVSIIEELRKINTASLQGLQLDMNPALIGQLDKIQMDLLEIKQIAGMGMSVQKVESLKTKLERGLNLKTD